MKDLDTSRLEQWIEDWKSQTPFPELTDDDLTLEEIKWLEKRVREVIAERNHMVLRGEDRLVSPPAKGLQ